MSRHTPLTLHGPCSRRLGPRRQESEINMDALLATVLTAHGGLDRWSGVKTLTVRLSLGGPFWGAKGWPDLLIDETIELDARREHLSTRLSPPPTAARCSTSTPNALQSRPPAVTSSSSAPTPARRSPDTIAPHAGTPCRWPTSAATPCGTTSPHRSCSPIPVCRFTRSNPGRRR